MKKKRVGGVRGFAYSAGKYQRHDVCDKKPYVKEPPLFPLPNKHNCLKATLSGQE